MYKAIVSCDISGGIGYNNKIPWEGSLGHKIDILHFKKTTKNSIVIMGRKTWESIPKRNRPLSNRHNIIITRRNNIAPSKDVSIFNSIEECDKWLNSHGIFRDWISYTRWVIGGSDIYSLYFRKDWVREVLLSRFSSKHRNDKKLHNMRDLISNKNKWESEIIANNEYFTLFRIRRLNSDELAYHYLLKKIVNFGSAREDRTNTGTLSLFGEQLRYNMFHTEYIIFPLFTSKRVWFKGIFEELMWFLRGETNSKILEKKGINIWKGNSSRKFLDSRGLDYPEGENGPIYGKQWRSWNGRIDQIETLIEGLKKNPYSRRHIISAWNVEDLDKMSLPPCHVLYQFYVKIANGEKTLSCQMYQRSGDMFLGVPFNVASTALLTLLIADAVGMKPYEIIHTIGDAHIYTNHIEQVKKMVSRTPLKFPRIRIKNRREKIENYMINDIEILDYISYPSIKAPMAI